jgi:hypothetical protein
MFTPRMAAPLPLPEPLLLIVTVYCLVLRAFTGDGAIPAVKVRTGVPPPANGTTVPLPGEDRLADGPVTSVG